ncbi:transposase [Cohnella lubricantis]|uniref:Transposase n=1 Tax=Cohnella lubricantis TaxID=2163172 RepID=A0A841TCZ2_9BACL|nr:transposase [Cohnella lubricantis]MBB6679174.1 transposase [Cohnella lubricantis]MBP2119322.1 hypothetical protein [Cohnella lubricantis]
MPEQQQERDATIYHYKLVRKIPLRPEAKYSYLSTGIIGLASISVIYGWKGLLYAIAGLLLMFIVHAIVLRITLRRVDELSERRWAIRFDLPWFGPLPVLDTLLSLFRRLHFHLLLIGCCFAGLCYPWSPSALLVSLVFWHIWLLAPRFNLLLRIRRERGDGVIRLASTEVSYYHR